MLSSLFLCQIYSAGTIFVHQSVCPCSLHICKDSFRIRGHQSTYTKAQILADLAYNPKPDFCFFVFEIVLEKRLG